MQHEFNDLLQTLRTKENEKNLASQRLNFLKERGDSLQEFLNKSEGNFKRPEESIEFTRTSVKKKRANWKGWNKWWKTIKTTARKAPAASSMKKNATWIACALKTSACNAAV